MIPEADRISNNKNKIEFYMRNNVMTHIDLLNGIFYNGLITSKVEDGVYIINDKVLGDQHIFLNEVLKVDTFRQPKDKPTFNNTRT
jgi:hypothetical protein